MKFDYDSYSNLVSLLKKHAYTITDYADYKSYPRTAILRHDIDFDISKSVMMAEKEAEIGVSSTYFVLLRSDYYNAFSPNSVNMLKRILKTGCRVGLHFDEMCYPEAVGKPEEVIKLILHERDMLSNLLGIEINAMSMHQPSREIIEAELEIPGMINSYRSEYFKESKYVSDSCRNWREPIEEIIESEKYDRLHILTHAFWWNETDTDIHDSLSGWVNKANTQRYDMLIDQVNDYSKVLSREEVR